MKSPRDHATEIMHMTPFAVEIRYDEDFEPSVGEASEALRTASEVHDLASRVIEREEEGG